MTLERAILGAMILVFSTSTAVLFVQNLQLAGRLSERQQYCMSETEAYELHKINERLLTTNEACVRLSSQHVNRVMEALFGGASGEVWSGPGGADKGSPGIGGDPAGGGKETYIRALRGLR